MPVAIDFIIQDAETKEEQGRMTGIIEFLREDQFRINLGPAGGRPKEFDGDTIVLTRKL